MRRLLTFDLISTVLRNPLYFVFLLLLGAGAYVTYTLNLWGPMLNMANAASSQALEEGKKRLREFLESSDTGRQAMGMTMGNGSGRDAAGYEMKRTNGGSGSGRRGSEDEGPGGEDI